MTVPLFLDCNQLTPENITETINSSLQNKKLNIQQLIFENIQNKHIPAIIEAIKDTNLKWIDFNSHIEWRQLCDTHTLILQCADLTTEDMELVNILLQSKELGKDSLEVYNMRKEHIPIIIEAIKDTNLQIDFINRNPSQHDNFFLSVQNRTLILQHTDLTPEDMKLVNILLRTKELGKDRLDVYNMRKEHIPIIIEVIKDTNLELINLSRHDIGDDKIEVLFSTLATLPNLTILNLSHNKIGPDGIKSLDLTNCPNLTILDLSYNHIGADGIKSLNLINCPKLTTLDLTRNNIGPDGIKSLASAKLPNLTTLHLSNNKIGDDGIKDLNLINCPNLTTLDLRSNKIGADGIEALKALIKVNYTITKMLWSCSDPVSQNAQKDIEESLQLNRELQLFFTKYGIKPSDCKPRDDKASDYYDKDTLLKAVQLFDKIYEKNAITEEELNNSLELQNALIKIFHLSLQQNYFNDDLNNYQDKLPPDIFTQINDYVEKAKITIATLEAQWYAYCYKDVSPVSLQDILLMRLEGSFSSLNNEIEVETIKFYQELHQDNSRLVQLLQEILDGNNPIKSEENQAIIKSIEIGKCFKSLSWDELKEDWDTFFSSDDQTVLCALLDESLDNATYLPTKLIHYLRETQHYCKDHAHDQRLEENQECSAVQPTELPIEKVEVEDTKVVGALNEE